MTTRHGTRLLALAGLAVCALVPASARAADPVTISLGSGALTIAGDDTASVIALRLLSGDVTHLVVDVGDDGTAEATLARSGFDRIDLDAGGGDDTVLIDDGNGAFTDTEATTVQGGRGADALTGGSGGETIDGGPGADTIDAGGGDDAVTGGDNLDAIDLGPGADRLEWALGGDLDTIDGGGGPDTVAITAGDGADRLALAAAGSRPQLSVSGRLVADLVRVETLDLALLGGADHLAFSDLSATALTGVDADLAADGAADDVVVDGTDAKDIIGVGGAGGEATIAPTPALWISLHGTEADRDTLTLEGHGGDDSLVAYNLAATSVALTLKGGDDDDLLHGSDGDDVLRGGDGDDILEGGPGTDVLDGGPGSNVLTQ